MLSAILLAALLVAGQQSGGTTIVTLKAEDGIVVAGDSRAIGRDGVRQPDIAKVIAVGHCLVGTWGMASGWFEVRKGYPKDLRRPHRVTYAFETFVREATAQTETDSPRAVAAALEDALGSFYLDWREYAAEQHVPAFSSGPDLVGFVVAGFEKEDAVVLHVRIPRDPATHQIGPPQLIERIPGLKGLTVAGASAAIERVGSRHGKERRTALGVAPFATSKALRSRRPWLTIEEARQYAVALIYVEAQDDPGVGFPVRLGTLRPGEAPEIMEVAEPPPSTGN